MEESEVSDLLRHRRLSPSPSPSPSPTATTPPPPMPKTPNPLDLSSSSRAPAHAAASSSGSYRHFSRSPGIPPTHPQVRLPSPYSQIPPPSSACGGGGGGGGGGHSRSLSQPSYFSLDSLPPLSPPPPPPPAPYADLVTSPAAAQPTGLPPRKAAGHRRSQSDIPFVFSQPPAPAPVKREADGFGDRRLEADAVDDLVSAYMDLDNLEVLNSSGTEEKHEDLDSRASGTRATTTADSSENEAESRATSVERKEGNKRTASEDLAAARPRHCRSLSMDSFMGKLNFGDESPKLPPSPSEQGGHLLRSGSMDGASGLLGLEFGNGEFTEAERKKIIANERLAEMVLSDPKRVKRILANRQSAARSKERKMRYISELEHKVQILQTEATTLSAQLTMLQRDSAGLATQNNELKIRLQAMEQQAHLRDALNESLTAEVQRLKLATGEISDAHMSKGLHQQMNSQMIQLQHLQIQQQQQQQQTQQPQRVRQQQQQQQQQSV